MIELPRPQLVTETDQEMVFSAQPAPSISWGSLLLILLVVLAIPVILFLVVALISAFVLVDSHLVVAAISVATLAIFVFVSFFGYRFIARRFLGDKAENGDDDSYEIRVSRSDRKIRIDGPEPDTEYSFSFEEITDIRPQRSTVEGSSRYRTAFYLRDGTIIGMTEYFYGAEQECNRMGKKIFNFIFPETLPDAQADFGGHSF